MSRLRFAALLFACARLAAEPASPPWNPEALNRDIERLKPLAAKMPLTRPGEWLSIATESAEPFATWLAGKPVTATETRRYLYVQPLGRFTQAQHQIIGLTAEHLGLFYGLEVKTLPTIDLATFPASATRVRADGSSQYLAPYILDGVLKPKLPADAAFLVAFTAEDLWPGMNWNFVFGMASQRDRTGVWSIRRFGDTEGGEAGRHLVLRRAIKVATHESGHMFSMSHCVLYRCGMNGANSLPEADRQPLEFCPECLAKLAFATHTDPRARLKALQKWYLRHAFKDEAEACGKRLEALGETQKSAPAKQPAR